MIGGLRARLSDQRIKMVANPYQVKIYEQKPSGRIIEHRYWETTIQNIRDDKGNLNRCKHGVYDPDGTGYSCSICRQI